MDPYKYIKNKIPGLGIYPIVENGVEYFRLQFGQPSNISPDYKGKKTQFFRRTEQGLKDLAAAYNKRKPFVIAPLSRADAAKAGSQKMTDFIEVKKGYSQDLLGFIDKNSKDPKYKVSNGPSKLYDDAVKFFTKDKKYTSVPEGFSKTADQTYEFLKGRKFQLPRNYEITEGFKMTGNFPRHPEQIKSLMAVKLLENNPNFVNINEMASKFYLTDVDRKELLKENKALVKATSNFLGRNKIRSDSAAGKYLQNKGFDFNKKLYEAFQFRTLEQDIIDKLETDIPNAERARLDTALKTIQRNRMTVFKKLKTEFPNLTKGSAMVLEHSTPQALINTGSFYPKNFMLKAQYVPQAFNQFKNTQFDTPLIKLVYQYNNETDVDIKKSLRSEIEDLRKDFNDRTKVKGKGYLDDIDFKFGQKVGLIDKTPTLDLLTDEGSIKQYTKNAAHSNAYFSSLDQKTVGIRDKRYSLDKLKLDIPENKTLDLFFKNKLLKAARTNEGGVCQIFRAEGGRIGYAAGSNCARQMEFAFDNDPLTVTRQIEKIDTAPNTLKTAATKFLERPFVKGAGKYGAIAAGGALAAGLVKKFMNDDPSTYLSNENQQKNLLIDMVTGKLDDTPEESPAILDYQLPALGGAAVAGTAAVAPSTIKAATSKRFGKEPSGITKTALKTLGRGLATLGTPAGLLATEPLFIAGQIQQGDSLTDIATNPFNYMGAAFAGPATEFATKGLSPAIAKTMRLGISPSVLKTVSRRFGLPGLALSLGISGYETFDDYRNKRGMFSEE
jgi:hypothetical protein